MYARDGPEKAIDFDCFHGMSIAPDIHIAKADMLEAKMSALQSLLNDWDGTVTIGSVNLLGFKENSFG